MSMSANAGLIFVLNIHGATTHLVITSATASEDTRRAETTQSQAAFVETLTNAAQVHTHVPAIQNA